MRATLVPDSPFDPARSGWPAGGGGIQPQATSIRKALQLIDLRGGLAGGMEFWQRFVLSFVLVV